MKKDIKKTVCLALTGLMLFAFTACTTSETTEPVMSHPEAYTEATVQYEAPKPGLDYFVLVNKTNKLPDDWEDILETVTVTNSVGDTVEVEKEHS